MIGPICMFDRHGAWRVCRRTRLISPGSPGRNGPAHSWVGDRHGLFNTHKTAADAIAAYTGITVPRRPDRGITPRDAGQRMIWYS